MWRRISIAAGVGLGLLVLFLTLLVTAPTPARPIVAPVRAWLVQTAAQRISQQLNGTLEIGALEGSLLRAPSLTNVVVRDHTDAVVTRIDAVHLHYQPVSLLRGKLLVHDIEIIRPDLTLSQAPDGTINLARLVPATSQPADSAASQGGSLASPIAVQIKRLRVEDGRSRLALGFLKGVTAISGLQITLEGHADDTGVRLTVQEIAAQTHPAQVNLTGLRGTLHMTGEQLRIEQLQLRTENTQADFNLILPGSPHPVQFSAKLYPVDGAEIGRLLADDTLRGKLHLDLQAKGPRTDLRLDADLRAEAGQVTFQGHVNAADNPRRYRGTLKVHQLDMAALANRETLKSDLNMVLNVDARGLSPQTLEGQLSISIQPSRLGDVTLSPSQIRIVAQSQRAHVEAFELISSLVTVTAGGSLDFQGTSDLTYEARVQSSQLRPLFGVNALNGGLHLQGSVKGAWPDLNAAGKLTATEVQLDANRLQRLELDYHASQLGTAPRASAQLRLRDLSIGEFPAADAQLQATYDSVQRKVTFATQLNQSTQIEGNLAGQLTLDEEGQHVVLDTVQLRFEDRTWHAPEPWDVTVKSGAFNIKSFRLAHGGEAVSLSGGIEKEFIRNVRLEASSVDLTYLQENLALSNLVAGRASLVVHASGTLTEPQFQAEIRLIPPAVQEPLFDRLQASMRYEGEKLTGQISARHDKRDVMRVDVEAPLDLALADVPLPERLLDAPVNLSVQILQPSLASLQTIAATPALSGTVQGNVTLGGTFAQLQLTSAINLQNLGVENAIEALDVPIRMTAELEIAGSVPELAQALTAGMVQPHVSRLDLRIASASGQFPASDPDQSTRPITVKDVRLQAKAAWSPDGFQATIDRFRATTDALDLPSITLSANAHLSPSQFDLRQIRIITPRSRIEGQGQMTWADRRFNLRLQVPHLNLTEFAASWPPSLSREVTGDLQLGGSTAAPTVMAHLRYGETDLHLQGTADLQRPAYSAEMTLNNLDIASFLPAGDGTFDVQMSLKGSGFSESERRADLHLTVNSQDFNLAPKLSGVVQAALIGSAVTLDEFHFDSVPAQLTAAGALSQTQQLQADYQVIIKDLVPLGSQLGAPIRANGGLTGSLSGALDALQAQSQVHLDDWRYGDFQGERVRVTLQGEELTTNPRATLTASLDGIQGSALPASSVTFDGRYRDQQAQVDFSVTDGPYRQTRIAGHVALQENQDVRLDTLRLQYRHWRWTNPNPIRMVRQANGTILLRDIHLQYGEQAIRASGSLQPSGPLAASFSLNQVEIEPWLQTFVPAVPAGGRMNLHLTAKGSVEHPEAAGVLQLSDLTWNDQPLGEIRLALGLADDMVDNHLQWHDGSTALLDVKGGVGLQHNYPLDLQVTSSSFDLARLAPFVDTIQRSSGWLDAQLRVGGTAKAPDLHGNVSLRDGALLLAVIGEPYRDIQARLNLANNRLDIHDLRMASETGTVGVNGWLEVTGDGLEQLQLFLQAHDFTAMNTPSIQARLTGAVEAQGSLDALTVKGDLTIPRARIRIDDFGAGPVSVSPSDLTVPSVYGGHPEGETDAAQADKAAPESSITRNLQTELSVRMPKNVWLVGPETALELRGSFLVAKNFDEPFVIGGSAETVRGFVGFRGKKFDLERGKMTFTGANELNPFLDVVARHEVSGYSIALHVEGESKRPQFNFSSTPDLAEEDILSLLVFGRTRDRLTGSEKTALSSHAAEVAGNVISGFLEKRVGSTLGLDTLEVDVEDEFGSGSVRGGRYVTQDLFISYQHQLGGQGHNTVGVEYSLSPHVKLKGTSNNEGQTSLDLLWRIDY